MRILSLCLFACLLALTTFAQPRVDQPTHPEYADLIEEARQMVRDHMAEHNLPGFAMTVSVGGETVWAEGFGYADLENRVPVTPYSKFRIGSISKPLTAAAIAVLYENDAIDLDAPVQTYVPYFPEKGYSVTTRQLGAHLAGIRHYRGLEFLIDTYYPTVQESIAIFAEDPLLHAPGSKYQYSSYGWNLISAVVEGAAEEEFLPYMRDQVFRPLGMINTMADVNGEVVPERVRFYMHDNDGVLRNAPYVDNSYKWAGGGFLSNTHDILRFANAHLFGTFVNDETRAMLWTEQQTTDGDGVGYGFGWSLRQDGQGRPLVGHTGGSIGGSSVMMIQPESEVVFVAFSNLGSANLRVAYTIGERFVDAVVE